MIVIVAVRATDPVPAAVLWDLIVPERPTTEPVSPESESEVDAVVTIVKVLVALSTTVYVPLTEASTEATVTLVPTAYAAPAPEAVRTAKLEPEARAAAVTVFAVLVAAEAVVTVNPASSRVSTAVAVSTPNTEGTTTYPTPAPTSFGVYCG